MAAPHDHDHDHDHDHGHGHGHGHGHQHAHDGPLGEHAEIALALLAGVFLLAGWLLETWGTTPGWLMHLCYALAYLAGAWFTVGEALENLRARRFEIDTLMLVAAAGAAALGEWAEGGLLLFLFSLGHSLEHFAMGRARRAIEALSQLAPDSATLREGTQTREVAVADLRPGDQILVKPNERFPADGLVLAGQSSVNEAPITGESLPVEKVPVKELPSALGDFARLPARHRVFAGSLNGRGALEVVVARGAGESTMARMVRLVTDAETRRSAAQTFTERFSRVFVPLVLGGVLLLLFAWVVIDEPFSASFYRAMAVLVAASPCALAISVPSAVLSGVARAGHGGVLIKGGAPLESLGRLDAIAFDKTGTLTEGKPRLTDVQPATGVSTEELLMVALAVERHSDHPLAAAVVEGALDRLGPAAKAPEVSGLQSLTGLGVTALLDRQTACIGKPALFSRLRLPAPDPALQQAREALEQAGRSTMLVRLGARDLGVLGLMDTPRPAAAGVMKALRALGIERLIMISGDNQRVAEAVAQAIGLTEAHGELMPEDKVQTIQALRAAGGQVAMVGDGVNDAPAMAHATVGIAMGAAGSDVALETADVALLGDDLAQLPFAVGLSRQTRRIIQQNLWVSLGVVAMLLPATLLGLNMGTAVLFHEGSTLLVVVNALRLLRYPLRRPAPLSP